MRNLTAGNKMNFTMFIFIVLIIIFMIIFAVINGLKNTKEKFEISSVSAVYDYKSNYIELENDALISKKWTGNYYLKEDITKKEYKLGDYSVSYDKNKKTIELFGTFYEVKKGGDISKVLEHNFINSTMQNRFYKINDRKYLIIGKNIKNNTGSLSTENYLIVILDKSGNALLLNNEINAKTINEMIISTDDFDFDVANETLKYNDEIINLKKIIGSSNQYIQQVASKDDSENNVNNTEQNTASENQQSITSNRITTSNTITTTSTTISKNVSQSNNNEINTKDENALNKDNYIDSKNEIMNTINGNQQSNNENDVSHNNLNTNNTKENENSTINESNQEDDKQDLTWVDTLNSWMSEVAAGFKNISGSKTEKKEGKLSKNIVLNSVNAGVTFIDVNYTITDPENQYNVVYLVITGENTIKTFSLDKNLNTYRITDLEPNTNYIVEMGYKIIYSDSSVEEVKQDIMTTRTLVPKEELKITRVSLNRFYYTLKLDNDYVYDNGCKIKAYLNDTSLVFEQTLKDNDLEKAALSGYSESFEIPQGYKEKNAEIKIVLEDTLMNGIKVQNNLLAKIVNY